MQVTHSHSRRIKFTYQVAVIAFFSVTSKLFQQNKFQQKQQSVHPSCKNCVTGRANWQSSGCREKNIPKIINDVENGIGLQKAAGSTPKGGGLNLNPSKVRSVALAQPCLSFVWTARNALVLWVSQDFWSVINKN